MENFIIISDSACDLTKEEIKENNIKVVPFYVSFDGQNYLKEKQEIEVRDFYQKMVDNPAVFPKTSTPSVQDYIDAFEDGVKAGKKVLCLCITSKMSGSYNTAMIARSMVLDQYAEAQIAVIDSAVITVLQGLLVLEVCRMKRNGLTLEQTMDKIEKIKSSGRIFFTIASIEYLKHGGRIGKLKGVIGSALKLKPLINFKDGEIFSAGIALSRIKAIQGIIDMVKNHFEKGDEKIEDYFFAIGYGYSFEEGVDLKEKLVNAVKDKFDGLKVSLYQIGATIGVHTGPHPIGIGFIKKFDAQ